MGLAQQGRAAGISPAAKGRSCAKPSQLLPHGSVLAVPHETPLSMASGGLKGDHQASRNATKANSRA